MKTITVHALGLAVSFLILSSACSKSRGVKLSDLNPEPPVSTLKPPPQNPRPVPPPGVPVDSVVVKSRATISIVMDPLESASLWRYFFITTAYAANGQVSIVVTNTPNTSMTLDTSQWTLPPISNQRVDFGSIGLSTLTDNTLNLCGNNGHQHCNRALIRIYTTGQAGAGIWNDVDSYGAPITTGITGATPTNVVGLDAANAYELQSLSLPNSKHVVNLSDFSPAPHYAVNADFTLAGSGSYTTTLVLEYGLSD